MKQDEQKNDIKTLQKLRGTQTQTIGPWPMILKPKQTRTTNFEKTTRPDDVTSTPLVDGMVLGDDRKADGSGEASEKEFGGPWM